MAKPVSDPAHDLRAAAYLVKKRWMNGMLYAYNGETSWWEKKTLPEIKLLLRERPEACGVCSIGAIRVVTGVSYSAAERRLRRLIMKEKGTSVEAWNDSGRADGAKAAEMMLKAAEC